MCPEGTGKLTAVQVLKNYTGDDLFLGRPIVDVNQVLSDGDRPIHIACVRGSLDDVRAFLEGGADVNAKGDLGDTPLHHAASRGLLDIMRVLLSHGADPSAKNEFGETPLDVSKLMSKDEATEILQSVKNARS